MKRPRKIFYLFSSVFLFLALFVFLFFRSCDNSTDIKQQVDLPNYKPFIYKNIDSLIIANKAKELDQIFLRLQKLTGFNGNVLYAEKGRIIFEKSYGYRDVRKSKDPLQITDAFQLASVSKMFTAMSIMILHKRGAIDYDRDVREYLPDFSYNGVTVRMLMTHRSGMPNYMGLADENWADKSKPFDNDDMLELFFENEPKIIFSPNRGFSYSNTGYALLASIVETASGKHFEEFVKENIFIPLDMDSSFVYNLRGKTVLPQYVEKGVPGHYHRGSKWLEIQNDYLNGVMGDKNVYTTVEDLYKFDRALDQFTLLSEEYLQEAFSPGSPQHRGKKDNYGFGWRIKSDMDSTAYHFGWWKGFRTFYIRDMKYQRTLIILTNKDRGPGSSNLWDIIQSDTLPLGCCSDFWPEKSSR